MVCILQGMLQLTDRGEGQLDLVSDNRYDLVVKDQGQIYLKYALRLVTRTRPFLVKVVHILYSDYI